MPDAGSLDAWCGFGVVWVGDGDFRPNWKEAGAAQRNTAPACPCFSALMLVAQANKGRDGTLYNRARSPGFHVSTECEAEVR